MKGRNKYLLLLTSGVLMLSCNEGQKKTHGPIVLGDPSTVVTETDPSKLQDMVTDLHPVIVAHTKNDSQKTAAGVPDTSKKMATVPVTAPNAIPAGPGLKAEFKETTIMIPGLEAKQAGNASLSNANGAVYSFISGKINGNVLHTTGNVTKVSQRYISVVVYKGKVATLVLDGLTKTTNWETVSGVNGSYNLKDLDGASLENTNSSGNELKRAVTRAAQRKHISSKKIQEMMHSIPNSSKAYERPFEVMLRSVMWKIDGKDANGKMFSKQIRLDVPM